MEKGKENVRLTSGKRKYNIIPKIMCLAAAFVLWLYVMQIDSVDTESTFTGARVYLAENTSEIESRNGLFVYSGDGTLVNVTVTGRKSVINSYTSDDIRVEADLPGVTAAGNLRYQAFRASAERSDAFRNVCRYDSGICG